MRRETIFYTSVVFVIISTPLCFSQIPFKQHVIAGSELPGEFACSVYAADIDGDGDMDILGTAELDRAIAWWENDGAEQFTKHTVDAFRTAAPVSAVDIDGDSDLDVLCASYDLGDIAWWENTGSGPANSPWPMYQHDARRTSCSPFVGPDRPYLEWSYPLTWGGGSLPSIAPDGTIYFGKSNHLYAITPDGTLKWTYQTGDKVYSSPGIGADGTIYVGSMDNKLHAINPDGTPKWTYMVGNDIMYSSPAIGADGTVFVGTDDNKLYAIGPGP